MFINVKGHFEHKIYISKVYNIFSKYPVEWIFPHWENWAQISDLIGGVQSLKDLYLNNFFVHYFHAFGANPYYVKT